MSLFGSTVSNLLQASHSIFALVLVVSMVMGLAFLYIVAEPNWKHVRVAVGTASLTYLVTFVFGLLIYPVFRVDVRAEMLDASVPQATGLFEIKENLAAIGAFVALSLLVLTLFARLPHAPISVKQLFGGLYITFVVLAAAVMTLAFIMKMLY
jgi:hypothetical protein